MTHGLFDQLLRDWGYVAVFVVVMIESFGIPVPGETMLIAAALYAGATGRLDIVLVVAVSTLAAIVGDNLGYVVGRYGGYRLLTRHGHKVRLDDGRIKIGRLMFLRHGASLVFWGRFVSVLRTYAAFLAGTNQMPWRRFAAANLAGALVWSCAYGFGYYGFGHAASRLGTPVDIAFGVVAVAITAAVVVWARRNEDRLRDQAEQVLPGPVADYAPSTLGADQQRELVRKAKAVSGH